MAPDAHRFGANSTVYVPPNRVHQVPPAAPLPHAFGARALRPFARGSAARETHGGVRPASARFASLLQLKNTGAETLQVMVIISKPPITCAPLSLSCLPIARLRAGSFPA